MRQINIEVELNKIVKNEEFAKFHKKQFLYCVNPENVDLLFVGLNPSEERNVNESLTSVSSQNSIEVQYPYFNKFKDISEKTKLSWGHLDLLYFRDTNQSKVYEIANKEGEKGKDFIKKQLDLSLELIQNTNPKIIVICNSLARDFFTNIFKNEKEQKNDSKEWLAQTVVEDDGLGTYRWSWNNTPIFFTSMLTGQRALDTGSYKRLIWHIKFVNNIISKQNS